MLKVDLLKNNHVNFNEESLTLPEIEILSFWILFWSIIALDYTSMFSFTVF
jgi:hypothetical protein